MPEMMITREDAGSSASPVFTFAFADVLALESPSKERVLQPTNKLRRAAKITKVEVVFSMSPSRLKGFVAK